LYRNQYAPVFCYVENFKGTFTDLLILYKN